MKPYLMHYALTDGLANSITGDDYCTKMLNDTVLDTIQPLQKGSIANLSGGFSARGVIRGRWGLVSLFINDVEIAAVGVCLHSKYKNKILSSLESVYRNGQDVGLPAVPFVASAYHVELESLLPRWFDEWVKCVGIGVQFSD